MKRLLLTGVLVGLSATAFASGRTGLAQAKGSFAIDRQGDALLQSAGRVAEVRPGDAIRASAEAVTIDTPGASLLVGPQSRVSFGEKSEVVFESGVLAVAAEKDSAPVVRHSDLLFQPAETVEGVNRSVFVVKSEAGNSLLVQGVENGLAVKDAESGEQIAWISPGDTIMLVRGDEGWRPSAPGQGAPLNIFRAQQPTVTGEETAVEDDDDDRRAIWWWVGAGVGAAAAAGGVYYYVEDRRDDRHRDRENKKNREKEKDRPPVSPILWPPAPTPPDTIPLPPPDNDFPPENDFPV